VQVLESRALLKEDACLITQLKAAVEPLKDEGALVLKDRESILQVRTWEETCSLGRHTHDTTCCTKFRCQSAS
jgi:hypothetical protein